MWSACNCPTFTPRLCFSVAEVLTRHARDLFVLNLDCGGFYVNQMSFHSDWFRADNETQIDNCHDVHLTGVCRPHDLVIIRPLVFL